MKPITFDIQRMIALRVKGVGYSELGRIFKKDHTTIMYHCIRLGIIPNTPIPPSVKKREFVVEEPRPAPKPYKYQHLLDEPMNKGKSYREYMKDALARPVEKHYHKTYHEVLVTGILGTAHIRGAPMLPEDYLPDRGEQHDDE